MPLKEVSHAIYRKGFCHVNVFCSACYIHLPLNLSRPKPTKYLCSHAVADFPLSSQLATLLINLIHLWQQAIFSYLADEHVMWNRIRSLPEVKIVYVCPFLSAYKACHSVRGGNWIGLTWFVGHKVVLVITHHCEPFHVLANWLGILILWQCTFCHCLELRTFIAALGFCEHALPI